MSRTSADRQFAIDAIFHPRRIVVLGASAQRRASGNAAILNLLQAGVLPELISVVHPTADSIEGLPAVQQVKDLDAVPDLALVSLPPLALMGALRELDSVGCRVAIVPTSGLPTDVQEELRSFLRDSAITVHGNNCMGVLNVCGATPMWFYEGILTDLPPGPIALVSQSGSATFLTRSVERQGFSRVVSTGNEIDLTSTDYLRWLATDPETSVVGLVLESITDERSFTDAVRALREAGKPLIVLKVGRTEAGNRATLAHTGALVSSSDAYIKYLDALDVPVVGDYDQLAVSLQLAASGVRSEGDAIVVITDSGGEAALAADLATDAGVALPALRVETIATLSKLIPGASVANPFDAGASPTTDEHYEDAYLVAASDPGVNAVMVILEGHESAPESETRANADMLLGAIRNATRSGKPVIATSSSTIATSALMSELLGDIPLARGIVNSLIALRAAAGNRRPLPSSADRPTWAPDLISVADWRAQLECLTGASDDELVQEILLAYGIPVEESVTVQNAAQADSWAQGRYPLVAKVSSPDIAHRSDVGGVVVDITSYAELVDAIDRIRANVFEQTPTAVIDGIEIQAQVGAAFEAMVGISSDPALGSIVVAGSGGVLVELLEDTRTGRVPVNSSDAHQLLSSTKLRSRMDGYRNLAPVTPTLPLEDVIVRLSWLAHDFRSVITEMDLNPVLVEHGSGRARVVDWLVNTAALSQA